MSILLCDKTCKLQGDVIIFQYLVDVFTCAFLGSNCLNPRWVSEFGPHDHPAVRGLISATVGYLDDRFDLLLNGLLNKTI